MTEEKIRWLNDDVHKLFEQYAREHLNASETRQLIYRKGQDFEKFAGVLECVLKPAYQSAENCGFKNWIYTGK